MAMAFRWVRFERPLCSAWTRRVRFPGVGVLGGSSAWRLGGLAGRQLTGPVAEAPEVNLRRSARSDHETELAARSPGGADANFSFFCRWKFPQKKLLRKKRSLCGGVKWDFFSRRVHPASEMASQNDPEQGKMRTETFKP